MKFQGLGVSPGRAVAPVRVMRETGISFDGDTDGRPAGSLSDLNEALASRASTSIQSFIAIRFPLAIHEPERCDARGE